MLEMDAFKQDLNAVRKLLAEAGESLQIDHLREQLVEYNEDMEFTIVGPTEANSLEGKIANDSPLGAALMGKERNNKVTVETPGGEVVYKILSVKRNRK